MASVMRRSRPLHAAGASHDPRRAPAIWPYVVVALAWGVALLGMLTGQRYLLDHRWLLEESGLPFVAALLVFVACWQIMVAGMMLPASLPVMLMMTPVARRQPRAHVVLASFVLGYGAIWTAFAVVVFTGDSFMHHAVDNWPWLAENSFIIGAGTFTLAGLFQLSPWKDRCLTACRRHMGFFARYYQPGAGSAWQLGLRHGVLSLGCCWALMLVMFGIGVGGLGWMAALAAVMWLEQVAPRGRFVAATVGIVLLALAVAWVVNPLPAL